MADGLPHFRDPDVLRVQAALEAAGGTLVMGPLEAASRAVKALRDFYDAECPATPDRPCFCLVHRHAPTHGNGPQEAHDA